MFYLRSFTIRHLMITALLLTGIESAHAASPFGLWDIQGKAQATIVYGGTSKTGPSQAYYHQAQFFSSELTTSQGIAFLSSQALNYVGDWTQQGDVLTIQYATEALNQTATGLYQPADFLLYLQNQFANLAVSSGLLTQTPTDLTATIAEQRESASLEAGGLTMTGNSQVLALVAFHDPADTDHPDSLETAQLSISSRYKGTRMAMPSLCCSFAAERKKNLVDSLNFLLANRRIPGVKTTPSGLQYKVMAPGYGPKPRAADQVFVWYRGMLPDGTVFDGNWNNFAVNGVVAGFTEGLKRMPLGAWYRFYIPPKLGYKEAGSGRVVPPNTALIFDVKLLTISR